MADLHPTSVAARSRHALPDRARARPGDDGFIRHPRAWPLLYRRLWLDRWLHAGQPPRAPLGVLFESPSPLPAGTRIEIQIPLRGRTQAFRGEVVLVRARGDRHEIGVWLDTEADADRACVVERICQLESYLKVKDRDADTLRTSRLRGPQAWFGLFGAGASTH